MSQSYTKPCNTCKQEIRMDQVNGKWAAYDLSGSGFHQCTVKQQQTNKPAAEQQQSLTFEQIDARLKRVEKMIDAFVEAGMKK